MATVPAATEAETLHALSHLYDVLKNGLDGAWNLQQPSGNASASALLSPVSEHLAVLLHLSASNQIRDLDLPVSALTTVLCTLGEFFNRQGPPSFPVDAQSRDLFLVSLAFLSSPELAEGIDGLLFGENESEEAVNVQKERGDLEVSALALVEALLRPEDPSSGRLFRVSDAGLKAREKAADQMAAVTNATATPDAHQPSRGSLSNLRTDKEVEQEKEKAIERASTLHNQQQAQATGQRFSYPSNAAAAAASAAKSGKSGAPGLLLDEASFHRALLAWLYSHCGTPKVKAAISTGLRACLQSFFAEFQSTGEAKKEHASAVRTALEVVQALLKGLSMRAKELEAMKRQLRELPVVPSASTESSQIEEDDEEAEEERERLKCEIKAISSQLHDEAEGWMTALLPLHFTPGTQNELSALLSVFHEPLTQCLFSLCSKELSPFCGGGGGGAAAALRRKASLVPKRSAAPSTMEIVGEEDEDEDEEDEEEEGKGSNSKVLLAVRRVLATVSAAWEETKRGNSTKAVLLLHESEQLLTFVLSASSSPEATASAQRFFLPLVLPIVTQAIESDNSRVAQVALGLFKQDSLVEALLPLPPLPASGKEGEALCESLEEREKRLELLRDLMRALHRGGVPHWNATVNKQTATVLTKLLQRDEKTARAAFIEACGGYTAPSAVLARAKPQPSFSSSSSSSASVDNIERDKDGFPLPPPQQPKKTTTAAAREQQPTQHQQQQQLQSAASRLPPQQPPVTITGVAPWAMNGGPVNPRALGGPSSTWTPGSGKAPPVTITGVAPWANKTALAASGGGGLGGAGGGLLSGHYSSSNPPPVTITGVAPWAQKPRLPPSSSSLLSSASSSLPSAGPAPVSSLRRAMMRTHGDDSNGSDHNTSSNSNAMEEEGNGDAAVLLPSSEDQQHAAPPPSSLEAKSDELDRFLLVLNPASATSRPAAAALPAAAPTTAAITPLVFDPSFSSLSALAEAEDGSSSSSSSSLASSAGTIQPADVLSAAPTLLPSLAFHDLAFGQELGSGTFSTVRYARQIVRGALGSSWPEYAVKIISQSTMRSLGYESSVRREMAILSSLSHPNVTRLVSAFRWRDGAYLVVEYCPKGDLHGILSRIGNLSEGAAKFLAAEVLAALSHLHEKGFVYGDCKPENILLVEDSKGGGAHAKITDFGAARPVNSQGRKLLKGAKDILANLRDGDWRAKRGLKISAKDSGVAASGHHEGDGAKTAVKSASADSVADVDEDSNNDDEDGDERIEGTEEYLSPEVASHRARPSIASDCYAFGVTLFQIMTGRMPEVDLMWPPPQQAPATSTASSASSSSSSSFSSRHVRFQRKGAAGAGAMAVDGSGAAAAGVIGNNDDEDAAFPEGFPEAAKGLVKSLLHPDPEQRLGSKAGIGEVLEHPWFASVLDAVPPETGGTTNAGPSVPSSSSSSSAPLDKARLLYSLPGPKVAAGVNASAAVAGSQDSAWSRRHNSTIWAPLPKAYLSSAGGGDEENSGGAAGGGAGKKRPAGGKRTAASYSLRELLALTTLPALDV